MITLLKTRSWNILQLFYKNKNEPLHLREISRQINLGEGPLTRHLNYLLKINILKFERDANLKKFHISKKFIQHIFPLYDCERFDNLPLLRRNAIKYYIAELKKKPVFVILFGSTAKETFKEKSDIDLLLVFNEKTKDSDAVKFAEAQTGMHLSTLQMQFNNFKKEVLLKQDHVIQSAIETGFPVYNHQYFYEVIRDERI